MGGVGRVDGRGERLDVPQVQNRILRNSNRVRVSSQPTENHIRLNQACEGHLLTIEAESSCEFVGERAREVMVSV